MSYLSGMVHRDPCSPPGASALVIAVHWPRSGIEPARSRMHGVKPEPSCCCPAHGLFSSAFWLPPPPPPPPPPRKSRIPPTVPSAATSSTTSPISSGFLADDRDGGGCGAGSCGAG